jgi:hypothetical protein
MRRHRIQSIIFHSDNECHSRRKVLRVVVDTVYPDIEKQPNNAEINTVTDMMY